MSLVDSRGQPVALGDQLGQGGEGTVYALAGRPLLAGKLYSGAVSLEKAAKIGAMVRTQNDRLLAIAAWPMDTLHERLGGPAVGLLMPRITGHRAVHLLYTVKSRRDDFPQANWPFLIAAAANVARAFAVVHASGQVIGDVNHANVVVARDATVRLIDCDSFQIAERGRIFPCDVGSPPFQPPELQDLRTFRGLVRTPNHDAFGLAVLIFHLLLMGRHPFAGRPLGQREIGLEQAIREFRFAYGRGAAARQMERPPHTLSLDAVSPLLALLFERAFAPEGTRARPVATDWIGALDTLAGQLTRCSRNPAHAFWNGLPACPWCEIEDRAGILFFVATARVAPPTHSFDLDAVWAATLAVASPGPAPAIALAPSVAPGPSPHARRFWYRRVGQGAGAALVAILGIGGWIHGVPLPGDVAAGNVILGVLIAWQVATYGLGAERARARQALDTARARWSQVEKQWKSEAGDRRFRARLSELTRARDEYVGLPARRQERLRRLETNRAEHQRDRFLDQHHLDDATIPGIGPSRVVMLRSYGIETAADVTRAAIFRVPGFGATLTSALLTWRREIERGFVFDPTRELDPRDILRVEADLRTTRIRLEQRLNHGMAELREIAQAAVDRRRALRAGVERARRDLAQTEADGRPLGVT